MVKKTKNAPKTYEELQRTITERYESLSRQLQQIAHFVVENPDDLALETITRLAELAEVQPSSMVRFAQALGFDGFSTMQRLFRSRLIEGSQNYRERVQSLRQKRGGGEREPNAILAGLTDQGIASLEMLRAGTSPKAIQKAVEIMAAAEHVYLIAQRRSFPVAFYLDYALTCLEKRCRLVDGVGGMLTRHIRQATPKDAIVAISFRSYSPRVAENVGERADAGVPVIAITDSPLSPLAAPATVCFEIADNEKLTFRGLVGPMCLAQTLVVGLSDRLDANK
ncbi:MAG: MurR/RpiR family transcriptional regulator [Rhodospirillales bacterium]|jgi:DNA-binding MurR/RpiR family transcriptional regulator|nr:MurR/RpiR family transcriptional regulator [Rhodospirillales bacterium]